MRKIKKARFVIFLTLLILSAAVFSVYSFTPDLIISDQDSADQSGKLFEAQGNEVQEVHKEVQKNVELIEKERRLFMEENQDLYAVSRGITDQSAGNRQVSQAMKQQETAPASKPAAQETVKSAPKPAAAAKVEPEKPAPAPAKSVPAAEAKPAPAPANANSGDSYKLDLLARLITAEAQGEPYEAKVAVGAVVMNRVHSSSWPNTIKDVIYQNINGYYQFTPVENGWINKPAEPGSIQAAKAALNGADPTNGAEFYYDDTTTNEWILSKPVSIRIGRMIFAF